MLIRLLVGHCRDEFWTVMHEKYATLKLYEDFGPQTCHEPLSILLAGCCPSTRPLMWPSFHACYSSTTGPRTGGLSKSV